MTDRKTTVHRLEHLRVDKFVSFILPLLFQFAKRNEKVMPPPPVCFKFTSSPPLLCCHFLLCSPLIKSSKFNSEFPLYPKLKINQRNTLYYTHCASYPPPHSFLFFGLFKISLLHKTRAEKNLLRLFLYLF